MKPSQINAHARTALATLGINRYPFDATGRLVKQDIMTSPPSAGIVGFIDANHSTPSIYLFDPTQRAAVDATFQLNGTLGVCSETIVFSLASHNALFRLVHSSQPDTLSAPDEAVYADNLTTLLHAFEGISETACYVTQAYEDGLTVDQALLDHFDDNGVAACLTEESRIPSEALNARAYVHTLTDEVSGETTEVAVQFSHNAVLLTAVGYNGAQSYRDVNALACVEAYEGVRLLVFDDPTTDEPSRNTPLALLANERLSE
jgi:hypothetical protein